MPRTRDDFKQATKNIIASRVGYRCSNPTCRRGTSRPDPANSSDAMNLGVAAHISAASPGGPRYDISMSPDQRKSGDNGIWLCQTCSKVIDNSEEAFPIATLVAWKRHAETIAAKEARSTLDEIGELINEIEDTHRLIVNLVLWSRQNDPLSKRRRMRDGMTADEQHDAWNQETRDLLEHHAQLQAMFQAHVSPKIATVLARSSRVLGDENSTIKLAIEESLHASVNELGMVALGEALLKIRAELQLR